MLEPKDPAEFDEQTLKFYCFLKELSNDDLRFYLFGSRIWKDGNFRDDSDLDVCIEDHNYSIIRYLDIESKLRSSYPGILDLNRMNLLPQGEFKQDIIDYALKI